MSPRRRLDAELVRRGLAASRAQAAELIAAGRVRVAGAPADKGARMVAPGEPVVVAGEPARFVGRGGEKLDAALDRFGIDVTGRAALDAGASTGGFTDALLQRGAARVVAVDVGHGQLHERLRADARVESRERLNVRDATPASLGGPFGVVVADLSFISLRTVAPALVALTEPQGHLVVLVKPQFEAGRRAASRGRGVIRDPAAWRDAVLGVASAISSQGATMMGLMASPIRGAEGNVEFLAHLRRGGGDHGTASLLEGAPVEAALVEAALVEAALAEAAGEG
ncbi:MAG: TlyA family RNA methyltransferase [Acidimicrobiales bacterium]